MAAKAGPTGTPTTYTIFGDTSDGFVSGTTQAGGIVEAFSANTSMFVGQEPGNFGEGFLSFDTSTVVGTITAVTLSLYGHTDTSTTDFTVEARLHDWGPTLESSDWVAGASLGTKTLLATLSTVGFTTAGYNNFTSEAAFASNINQSGFTRFLLCSNRHRTLTAPSGTEHIRFWTANATGTSQDPKLVIDALV